MARTRESNGGILKCSFCGKSQNDVRKLIAGPTVYICDECVELCNDIIVAEWEAEVRKQGSGVSAAGARNEPVRASVAPRVESPGPLQVRHTPLTPGDVPADLVAELRRNDYPYVRFYRTEVTNNTDRPIRIVLFDGLFWQGGRWFASNLRNNIAHG